MTTPSPIELMTAPVDHVYRNQHLTMFYYGVQDGLFHLLPIGAVFISVHSPSPFMTFPAWLMRQFMVVETKSPTNNNFERYYQAIDGRELTADEITYFQHVISQLPPVVKKASESNEDRLNSSFEVNQVDG